MIILFLQSQQCKVMRQLPLLKELGCSTVNGRMNISFVIGMVIKSHIFN